MITMGLERKLKIAVKNVICCGSGGHWSVVTDDIKLMFSWYRVITREYRDDESPASVANNNNIISVISRSALARSKMQRGRCIKRPRADACSENVCTKAAAAAAWAMCTAVAP